MYRKLKRVWSNHSANYIPKFREVFPELNKVSNEEMADRWIKLGINFYAENITPVNVFTRLTLPFAIILMILMFIGLPVVFLATGSWRYSLGEKNRILNWFRSLGLL
jgi:hypothetical protein